MLKTNFHTHTIRCGHAIGSDEEYVLAAIKAGVKTLGFSDHAPYEHGKRKSPDERLERMYLDQLEDYRTSILSLKEKYADQITIYCGLEVECYPEYWDLLTHYRKTYDYCILGQHTIASLDSDSTYRINTPQQLQTYVDSIEYACAHNLCDYICHPDVCLWGYPRIDDAVKEAASRLASISLKYDVPLEINCGSGVLRGPREYEDGKRIPYPSYVFFEEFARRGCKTIVGLDIHDPKLFLTDEYLNKALEIAETYHPVILHDFDLPSAAAERKKLFY